MRRSSTGRTLSQLNRRRLTAAPNRLAVVNRRRRRVFHLWEAFLQHMDDFDRLIEFQLRRRLDPLVAAPVPAHRGHDGPDGPSKRRGDKETTKNLVGALVLLEQS